MKLIWKINLKHSILVSKKVQAAINVHNKNNIGDFLLTTKCGHSHAPCFKLKSAYSKQMIESGNLSKKHFVTFIKNFRRLLNNVTFNQKRT